MIVRFLTLPGEVRALMRLDPATRCVRCRVLDVDPESTATERRTIRNAAMGASRRLARDHGVRDARVELEATP